MPFQLYHDPHHFDQHPEFGLGFHIVSTPRGAPGAREIFILFGQLYLLRIDQLATIYPLLNSVRPEDMEQATDTEARANPYSSDLTQCDAAFFTSDPILMALTSGPGGTPSAPPPTPGAALSPPLPYGHLPFQRNTRTNYERFVRFTAFATDPRITSDGGLLPGTFAAPASEERMVPGGFAAVGRYALPTLMPAVWRRDIIPPINRPYHSGAVVPMFGQAGGGVEVMFGQALPANSAHQRVARIEDL
jgi:hypothetical protein